MHTVQKERVMAEQAVGVIGDPRVATKQHAWRSVAYRWGAIPSLETVNVLEGAGTKTNVFPQPSVGPRNGIDMQTRLLVDAWVRDVAYTKSVWVDVHVFDHRDDLIHSETFPLAYGSPAGGGGDVFTLDQKIYQGSIATPGRCRRSPMPAKSSTASTTRWTGASSPTPCSTITNFSWTAVLGSPLYR